MLYTSRYLTYLFLYNRRRIIEVNQFIALSSFSIFDVEMSGQRLFFARTRLTTTEQSFNPPEITFFTTDARRANSFRTLSSKSRRALLCCGLTRKIGRHVRLQYPGNKNPSCMRVHNLPNYSLRFNKKLIPRNSNITNI